MKVFLQIKKHNVSLEAILLVMYLMAFTIKYFVKGYAFYANIIIICIGTCSYIVAFASGRYFNVIKIMIMLDSVALICLFINHNYYIDTWFMMVSMQGVFFLLLLDRKISILLNYYFYFVVCYMALYALLRYSPEKMLDKASENFISIILLSLFCVYYLSTKCRFKVVCMWCLCTVLCIWAEGRSGILSFLIFAAFYFAFGTEKSSILRKCISMILFIGVCYWAFVEFRGVIHQAYMSEGRLALWQRYCISTLSSIKNILVGTNFMNDSVFVLWGKNLHNSFLMIHAEYGVIPLAATIVGIIKSITNKHRKVVYCMVAIIVRAMTDSLLLGDICDIPFYYLIFKSMNKNKDLLE